MTDLPDAEVMCHIAKIQEGKEAEIEAYYAATPQKGVGLNEAEAARAIQRTYRGHRARRELAGLSLDPTTRWVEVLRKLERFIIKSSTDR